VLNRRADAGERLVAFAEQVKAGGKERKEDLAWRASGRQAAGARADHGITQYIVDDTEECRARSSARRARSR